MNVATAISESVHPAPKKRMFVFGLYLASIKKGDVHRLKNSMASGTFARPYLLQNFKELLPTKMIKKNTFSSFSQYKITHFFWLIETRTNTYTHKDLAPIKGYLIDAI